MGGNKPKIYLVGSFTGFRDRLINALSGFYDFSDPRKHRQSCTAKTVIDDMTEGYFILDE